MTRTERRAADRRGTVPTGIRRAQLPHRTPRPVPPPLV
jgi:hypothetical protein